MYKKILVPVVFDEEHDTQASFLAAKALANEGAAFTVMHVLEVIPAYAMTQIPAEILADSRADTERKLDRAASALPGASPVLVAGHAGREIVEFARENAVDCIIMASQKPGLGHFFMGSTADWVVRHAKCSVHVAR